MASKRIFALGAIAASVSACTLLATFNDRAELDGVDASADSGNFVTDATSPIDATNVDAGITPNVDSAVSDVAVDAPNPCPTGMAPVTHGSDIYCIDSTEVTFGAYQNFLNANVDPSSQLAICAFNGTFAAKSNGDAGSCPPGFFQPASDPNFPMGCVTWCDAYAYCQWAGKHLCGAAGTDGGASDFGSSGDQSVDEWFNACSDSANRSYPYGDTFDNSKCNTSAGAPIDVAHEPGCVGGYPGIFDMSGNVQEWENSCKSYGSDFATTANGCYIRGGAYWFNSDAGIASGRGGASLTCRSAKESPPPNAFSNDWGFRCCK